MQEDRSAWAALICTITRICNICNGNYDDASVCPHKLGTFYEDIAYYFYISEWLEEANLEKKYLAVQLQRLSAKKVQKPYRYGHI